MTNPLTDEKMKAARCWATISPSPSFDDKPGFVTVADLVAEIDRLREENGRLSQERQSILEALGMLDGNVWTAVGMCAVIKHRDRKTADLRTALATATREAEEAKRALDNATSLKAEPDKVGDIWWSEIKYLSEEKCDCPTADRPTCFHRFARVVVEMRKELCVQGEIWKLNQAAHLEHHWQKERALKAEGDLRAAREAMGKVPHLCESDCGAAFCVADDPDHREEYCAAFGAACAVAALRESKETSNG